MNQYKVQFYKEVTSVSKMYVISASNLDDAHVIALEMGTKKLEWHSQETQTGLAELHFFKGEEPVKNNPYSALVAREDGEQYILQIVAANITEAKRELVTMEGGDRVVAVFEGVAKLG